MSDESLRVLLVDDDMSLREPLADFLRSGYEYHVDAAADGEQALEFVTTGKLPYHVALIDDVLAPGAGKRPIRSGVDLMSHIKTHSPRTETIIFTGWGMDRALEALQAGAFRYLSKPFNPEELAILIRHAAQQHHLVKERDTLKLLSAITDQLNLSLLDLETLLQVTITQATMSIGADEGSLLVIKDDRSLHTWRSYGLPEMSLQKAELIRSTGCAKWVLEHCQSVRLDDFRHDPRWRVLPNDPLQQGSALLVPLKDGDKAIGVLSFTTGEFNYFSEEHQILIESIASQAAIAIRHADLFKKTDDQAKELSVEKEKLDWFIASSPNGQIAIDTHGKIKHFSERAQQILGYTEKELKNKSVVILYQDEAEARRIDAMLTTDPKHKIQSEPTTLMTKDGRPVPARLSASYWKDASGERIGGIGQFENLTEIQKKDAQVAVLSKASKIMAEATTLKVGLDALARLLVEQLQRSFCSIFLHNEISQTLVSEVSHVPPKVGMGPDNESFAGFPMKISDCALLLEIFNTNKCKVISHSDDQWRDELDQFVKYLRLKDAKPIQTLMLVPLMKDKRIVGLFMLGEVQAIPVYPLQDDTELATAIAHQITGLIDRRRQSDIAERRGDLSERLSKALFHSDTSIPKLELTITQYAAEVLGYSKSFLFAHHADREEFQLCRAFPENGMPVIQCSSKEGLLGEIARTSKPYHKTSYDNWPTREKAFDQFRFKTVVAAPLKLGDQIEYVLVVGSAGNEKFVEIDEEILERLAMRAAQTIENARRMKELRTTRNVAKTVAKVTTLGDLNTTLNRIANGAKGTTGCEPIVIFVYDQKKDSFRNPRTKIGVRNEPAVSGEKIPQNSIVYKIMRQGQTVIANDVTSHSMFKGTQFALRESIKSCIAVPLKLGEESVGVLFVNDRLQHNFTENEQKNIELFANQAAVAIWNARLYEARQRRVVALEALHEAVKEITDTLDEHQVISKVIPWMWKLADEQKAFVAVRRIKGDEAISVAYYPAPPPYDPPIQLKPGPSRRIGITGRIVRDKCSQRIDDVSKDSDYLSYYPTTKAELAVPIIIDEEVVYVIDLEHPELNAFDDEDRRDLESLATQAAIAIQNARKYKSLIEANVKVKASTDLSWTNMASGVWHHQVEGKAVTIAGEIDLVLDDPDSNRLTKKQKMRLEKIKNLAEKILSYKITPPISCEDGVTRISINDLLTQLFSTRRENDPFRSVYYKLELLPDDPLEVWISPDWLRIACDIVVDNALRAVKNSPLKVVSATTRYSNGLVEIAIEDTGSGIPKKIFDKLFTGVISKEDGGEGLGIGLLEAQAIIRRYSGEIRIPWTSSEGETTGTRVVIELPRLN